MGACALVALALLLPAAGGREDDAGVAREAKEPGQAGKQPEANVTPVYQIVAATEV